ncbi:hypothetical protein EZ449_07205 [Pedobacter frigidisoli]|uniref:Uncharacterized protein n=2 Tax=Pedobacter TaxID=84567 RepID=A0A4R0P259_9SPHI|nr:hypothetical protein D7004_18115 [Pedobacter jejuensis]RYD70279.1 MAG: hypothetical protein EOP55_22510 [Sphingobacteriales bacterium]RZL38623.1 MAG: hypothetical protein EOO96_02560 [Pedobacter sp.]TCD10901.1 hypothetical protein EZ449_07205 [Pedobacter frigidisoli]
MSWFESRSDNKI